MLSLSVQTSEAREERSLRTEALVYPVIGTLLVTGAVVSRVCRTPDKPFTSWWSLLALGTTYVGIALLAHAGTVWGICRVYRETPRAPVGRVVRGIWLSAALLPVTVLLAHGGSAWATPMLPAIAGMTVLFVRRGVPEAGRNAHSLAPAGMAPGLFGYAPPPALLGTMLSAVLVAMVLELTVAMLLSWQYALASLLLGIAVAVVLWRVPLGTEVAGKGDRGWGGVARDTAVALLLTLGTLLPSLNGSSLGSRAGRFLGMGPIAAHAPPMPSPAQTGEARGGALSGVILTLPPKPRQTVVPPPPMGAMIAGVARVQPRILKFDGAYWYFRSPDVQPRPDARTVRGDPTKVQIRSTDLAAIVMEAHQTLEPALRMDCCSAIRVTVQNADTKPGAIGLELVLGGRSGKGGVWRESLGTLVIPSSLLPRREGDGRGATEVLEFPVPGGAATRSIAEITVAVRPAPERSRMGAQVAVEQFELVPAR